MSEFGDRRVSRKGVPPPSSYGAQQRMKAVRQRDTLPEVRLRSLLHSMGLRYRLHSMPIPGLKRRADILFRKWSVAVYVDGCFWHGCPIHGTWPKSIKRSSGEPRSSRTVPVTGKPIEDLRRRDGLYFGYGSMKTPARGSRSDCPVCLFEARQHMKSSLRRVTLGPHRRCRDPRLPSRGRRLRRRTPSRDGRRGFLTRESA